MYALVKEEEEDEERQLVQLATETRTKEVNCVNQITNKTP